MLKTFRSYLMGNESSYHNAQSPSKQLVGENGFSVNIPNKHHHKRSSTPKMQARHTAPVAHRKSRRSKSSYIESHTHSHPNSPHNIMKHSLPSLEIKQSHSLNAEYDGCTAEEKEKESRRKPRNNHPDAMQSRPRSLPTSDPREVNQCIYKSSQTLCNPELIAMQLVPPRNQCISIASIFKYKKLLGKGVSCRVLLVLHKKRKKQYALKEMTRANHKNAMLFHSEVNILRKLRHEHIVEFDDIYMDIHNYYIALEYCTGGTLLEKIIEDGYFTERIGAMYIRNILTTLSFMHNQGIAHLDLKLNNIVFRDKEPGSDGLNVIKIIDFGLSEHIKSPDQQFIEIHGSLHYFPPEIFHDEGRIGKQLYSGDMWCLGVIAYLMLSGKLPFYGKSQRDVIHQIKHGHYEWPKNVRLSADCKSFIKAALCLDWRKRIDADTALKHKWLRDMEQVDKLDTRLMEKVKNAGKLNKLLVHSVLQEMDDAEKTLLLDRMESIEAANMKSPQEVTAYILNHRLSVYQQTTPPIDVSTKSGQLKSLANDHTLFLRGGVEEEDQESDHAHDGLLEDLMDEVEIDFRDYNFHEDTLDEDLDVGQLELLSTSLSSCKSLTNTKSLSNPKSGDVSLDGISVTVFKKILLKSAKRESINLDGIVGVLDPDNCGIISLSSIHTFDKKLSDYKVVESQSSGIDDVGDHQEETVHMRSPIELKNRVSPNSNSNSNGNSNNNRRFKFDQALSPGAHPALTLSSGDSKSAAAEISAVPEENALSSDSELDFNKVMQSM